MILRKAEVVWAIFYIILFGYLVISHGTNQVIYELIENQQKLLFNNTVFFTFYLYVSRKNFLSTEILVRYKSRLPVAMIKHGIYLSATYSILTYAVLLLSSSLLGREIVVDGHLIFHVMKLFAFCLYLYLVYIIIYLLWKNQALAALANVVVNFLILIVFIGLRYNGGLTFFGEIDSNIYWYSLGFINIAMGICIYFVSNIKEHLR